jgi:site-specific DNA-adenine methylase
MSTPEQEKFLKNKRQDRNMGRFVAAVAIVLFLILARGCYNGEIKFRWGGPYMGESYDPRSPS